MLTALFRRRGRVLLVGALIIAALIGVAAFAFGGSADVVVYNGRSQYGDETVFKQWEDANGKTLELRGGTAPELFERLRSEGDGTPADMLVTTDLANLWRAKEAGLLEPVTTPTLEDQVPAEFRDPDDDWWGLSVRIRTPMRSTPCPRTRSRATRTSAIRSGRASSACGRRTTSTTSRSSPTCSPSAAPEETRALLESWMANDPQILGSDVDVLEAIAARRCDVGLTNHYYLARILADDPDFPVAPAWPDQDGAGAHANLSGAGLVKGSAHAADATSLLEHLTSPQGQEEIVANGELAVNPEVPPAEHIADWADVELDPIDVAEAGALLPDAVQLMQDVGWR